MKFKGLSLFYYTTLFNLFNKTKAEDTVFEINKKRIKRRDGKFGELLTDVKKIAGSNKNEQGEDNE